jgi:MinD-like ATPase involved in chromosome partitioning or flagellar assembly
MSGTVQTITFYAYKGGTGRSLTLANAAKYLSRLGQSVLAIDLDLEAPGLHHKLRLGAGPFVAPPSIGVVDYLSHFIDNSAFPEKLAPYVTDVPKEVERDGPIRLMAAGNILGPDYWRRLAGINWHSFLFGKDKQGLRFFLELKERIKEEFNPNFLLIDARTGITEVGGVATTILPDQVVCFVLNNQENLEGTRAVLRGIERASAARPSPIHVVPVVSRLPQLGRRLVEAEAETLSEIRVALCEPKPWDSESLALPALHVVHSDESLAVREGLRIGSNRTVDESLLLRDYLRLFSQIIPSETVASHLDRLVTDALADVLEKPDRAQGELEALTIYCPHPTSYLALLKLYRLRSATAKQLLQTAVRYWELSQNAEHPILRQVVQDSFQPERVQKHDDIPQLSEFLEAVWNASPDHEPGLGFKVANHLFRNGKSDRGVNIVQSILDQPSLGPTVIVKCINLLVQGEQYDQALSVVEGWSPRLAEYPDFQSAWASAVVRKADPTVAKGLFESKHFRPAIVMGRASFSYIRLLMLTGKVEELDAALTRQLEHALAKEDMEDIGHVARLYDETGQFELFRERVRSSLSKPSAERILSYIGSVPQRQGWIRKTRTGFVPG